MGEQWPLCPVSLCNCFPSRIYILPTNTEKEISSMCPNYFQTRKESLCHCRKNPPKHRKTRRRDHTFSLSHEVNLAYLADIWKSTVNRGRNKSCVKQFGSCYELLFPSPPSMTRPHCPSRVPPEYPYSIPPSFVIAARQELIKAWSCSQPCREVHSCLIALKLIPAIRHTFPFLHLLH